MNQVKEVFRVGLDFFNQPLEVKMKYLLRVGKDDTGNNGYTGMEQERCGQLLCISHEMTLLYVQVKPTYAS